VSRNDVKEWLASSIALREEITHKTGQEIRLSATYLVLLTVASVIAAMGGG
jgi:hypothetical protein